MKTNTAKYFGDREIKRMLLNSKRCLNCGGRIDGDQAYCCNDCYLTKPPKMAYIEQQYGTPIREFMLNLLNRFPENYVADYLGITPWTLHKWKKKQKITKVVRYE